MARLFKPYANFFSRLAVFAFVALIGIACLVGYGWDRSSYSTHQGLVVSQPVPFSHEHHVGSLGIDCRYCHTSVERSNFAGIPPTSTCMNCHQQLWTEAEVLKPVRDSWQTGKPLRWQRVNRLPGFVYFNHSVHVNKGVGCVECHGQVNQMPLMYAAQPLTMQWCIDCHRDPLPHLRPACEEESMTWQQPASAQERAAQQQALFNIYQIRKVGLTDCSTCHR